MLETYDVIAFESQIVDSMISSEEMVSGIRLIAALGCGLIAGVFFAFSTFVMKALARLPAEQGISAMQSINIFAVKSWFLVAFLGTAVACGFAIVFSFLRWSEASSLLLEGGAIFLIGCFLVTIVFNVPMNNALAAMPADHPGRATRWADYVTKWIRWNHVRTIASLAAAILLMAGWAGERKHHDSSPAADRPSLTDQR